MQQISLTSAQSKDDIDGTIDALEDAYHKYFLQKTEYRAMKLEKYERQSEIKYMCNPQAQCEVQFSTQNPE